MSNNGERKQTNTARTLLAVVIEILGLMGFVLAEDRPDGDSKAGQQIPAKKLTLASGQRETLPLGIVKAGETDRLLIAFDGGPIAPADRILVELTGSGSDRIRKDLHAGDRDLYLPYRPSQDGQASLCPDEESRTQSDADGCPRRVDATRPR